MLGNLANQPYGGFLNLGDKTVLRHPLPQRLTEAGERNPGLRSKNRNLHLFQPKGWVVSAQGPVVGGHNLLH